MTKFEFLLKQSNYKLKNEKSMHSYFVTTFWEPLLNYTQNTPSDSDYTEEINSEITNISKVLVANGHIRSHFLRLCAQKHLSKNTPKFRELYTSIIEEQKEKPNFLADFTPYEYSYNKETFYRQFVMELIYADQSIIEDRLALIEDKIFKEQVYKDLQKTELKRLEGELQQCDSAIEKSLKKSLIQILLTLGDYLTKFNLLEKYGTGFERMLENYGLKDLSYPVYEDEENCISLKKLFTENYLQNLSLTKLMALTAFWTNRTTKNFCNLNEILFITNELNLWDDVKNRRKQIDIDSKTLETILIKTDILSELDNSIFDKVESIHYKNPHMTPDQTNDEFQAVFDEEVEKIQHEYENYFNKLLPNCNNNLNDNLSSLHGLINAEYLLYKLKNFCMFNLLIGCIDQHYSKNWGIVPYNDRATKFASIYFDIEGLNMPLRLHIPTEELIDFLNAYTGEPTLPIYKGADDLKMYSRYITTSVLAPMCKKQHIYAKTKLANPSTPAEQKKFLSHVYYLKNIHKTPASFKTKNEKNNYFNLETNEYVTKIQKGANK